ncbi:hypothetical protein [Prevotella pectinovora]|uniref:hypothetical protein n=1 Tax=Prevotella pectinovora TaxID=1602169 RepID=UPI0030807C52
MQNNKQKTNLKFNLYIITEEVSKEEETEVDFYVNIEELNELIVYLRKYNIDPNNIRFRDIEITEETPAIINRLYDITYNIAFQKHLKALMWTEGDFYDEANHLSYTDDLDIRYSRYDMNTDFCDSDEEYYEKIRMNESIENEYSNRYSQAIRLLKNKIIANDIIEFNGILCELV